jgi:hypothetical protein
VTCDDARSRRVPNRCFSFSYLCQLKIVTDLGEYGPFGDGTSIPFGFTPVTMVAKILQHDFELGLILLIISVSLQGWSSIHCLLPSRSANVINCDRASVGPFHGWH